MQIRLKKGRDGPDSIACVRDDGTSTWRRIQRALVFHDLAHYAVETEIGAQDGFFGLVASGWSFEAFADAEERSNIPPATLWVELVVTQFLTETIIGELYDEDAFHDNLARAGEKMGLANPRRLQADEIARVRGRVASLVARWRALEPGDTLELPFSLAGA